MKGIVAGLLLIAVLIFWAGGINPSDPEDTAEVCASQGQTLVERASNPHCVSLDAG